MAKKKTSNPKPAPAKKSVSPAKQLKSARADLSKARRPLYAINSKINNAPSRYYARKYKKEREAFLAKNQRKINKLVRQRDAIKEQLYQYAENQRLKKNKQSKVYGLEKRIRDAVKNRDLNKVKELRFELLKQLGEIDKLREAMGVKLDKTAKEDVDLDDQDGGEGYEIDAKSPYAIWEAIRQLNKDLDEGIFDYFIVNGKRFSSDNPIQITAEASAFWISSKKKTDGTPLVNRFINYEKNSVKYLYIKMGV